MGNITSSEVSKIPYRVPSAEADDPSLLRPPVCIKDGCNPGGMASPTKVPCTKNEDCAGGTGMKCINKSCWIQRKRSETLYCTTDAECAAKSANRGNDVVRCLLDSDGKNGQCVYKDLVRAAAGHVCDNDGDCAVGQCDKANPDPLLGTTYCSGGCACSVGYRQDVDTTTPLGYKCSDNKACDSNPCNVQPGNGNACVNQDLIEKGYSCDCGPAWTGPNCQTRVKKAYGWLCKDSAECESWYCDTQGFSAGGQCSLPVINNSNKPKQCDGGQCWWNGTAPMCKGQSDEDCKNRDPGYELIGVDPSGDGNKCNFGLKGLCAPRACTVDAQCGTTKRQCCASGNYAGFCRLLNTC
jgi:hypothetical protein